MDLQDKAIRRFRRRLARRLLFRYVLPLATGWSFAWGVTVLALRAATGIERMPLLWGLSGLAACAVVAFVLARRHMPATNVLRALLDEQNDCGGLLMAGAEQDLGAWRQKMPALRLPRVQWAGRRSALLLAVAAGFVVLAFLVPRGLPELSSNSPLEIDREVERLIEQMALLKGESIFNSERASFLKDKLTQLSEHSSAKDPARTLEALDHLHNLAGETARTAVEERTRRRERLGEAEALVEILRQGSEKLSPRVQKDMLAELKGLLDKSGVDWKQIAEHVDPESLQKLAKELQSGKIDLASQIEKLHKAGLIDDELLSKGRRAGESDSEALQAFLQKNTSKIGRRTGAAPLTWNETRSEDGYPFKEEILPPGALASLKSRLVNVPSERREQAPTERPRGGGATSGALGGAAGDGGSAQREIVLPRHRAAVKRYFERTESRP